MVTGDVARRSRGGLLHPDVSGHRGASKLPWISLDCEVTGTLDRVEGVTQFTGFDMRAHLMVPDAGDADRARHALEKAERTCLISSSLKGSIRLDATVEMAEPVELGMPDS
jgi:uncharacterized OsmC-like protein